MGESWSTYPLHRLDGSTLLHAIEGETGFPQCHKAGDPSDRDNCVGLAFLALHALTIYFVEFRPYLAGSCLRSPVRGRVD